MFVWQVWNLTQWLVGFVVQEQRFPSGESGHGWYFLCGGCAAAGLPPLPGVHQLHHLGVHVASQDLLPEALRQRAQPVRPRRLLQPVGLLLPLQDRGVGANVPQKQHKFYLTSPHKGPETFWPQVCFGMVTTQSNTKQLPLCLLCFNDPVIVLIIWKGRSFFYCTYSLYLLTLNDITDVYRVQLLHILSHNASHTRKNTLTHM